MVMASMMFEDQNRDGSTSADETSPLDRDSDEDGLDDGVEDANQNGRIDFGETDPRTADTDGDGLLDSEDEFPLTPYQSPVLKGGQDSCSQNPDSGSLPFGLGVLILLASVLRRRD